MQYHEVELSILLTDNEEIRLLNLKYLHKDKPTNVISFSQGEELKNKNGKKTILGDVVISVERAIEEARKAGMEPLRYIIFLLIHGILHLVGFDHGGSSNRRKSRKMMYMQKMLMKRIEDLLNIQPC